MGWARSPFGSAKSLGGAQAYVARPSSPSAGTAFTISARSPSKLSNGSVQPSLSDRARKMVQSSRASPGANRSEEHTSELQSLMRISYAVICLKKKKQHTRGRHITTDYDYHTQTDE